MYNGSIVSIAHMTLNTIWRSVLNFILPARCVGCRAPGDYLCANCLAKLPPPIDQRAENVISLFEYDDVRVKKLIWRLKYHGRTALAEPLGALMYESLLNLLSDWQAYHPGSSERWLVMPIPLSPQRARRRGYNQAEKLARYLVAGHLDLYELDTSALIKIKETATQVSVRDRAQRLKNLQGAFAVTKPERVSGRRVVLVDDVTTTGATLAEARRVLKAAGARAVLGVTIAHG